VIQERFPCHALLKDTASASSTPTTGKLEETEMEPGWMVSVQSPNTAFMLLSMHPPELSVDDVLEATLAALRDDYRDLECEPVRQKICRRQAKGLRRPVRQHGTSPTPAGSAVSAFLSAPC
jgi:hypothetical protein